MSDAGGGFEAHWTFEGRGGTVTEEHPLTREQFALQWDGIAASVRGGGVFWRCLVTDPTRLVDPDRYHVVSTVEVRNGRLRHRTFMVPSSEADPVFVAWLDNMAVPRGVGCDRSMPARGSQAAAMAGHAEIGAERSGVPAQAGAWRPTLAFRVSI